MPTQLTFHGATRTVTGSCFLLERDGARLLIDCGLYQGPKMDERNREPFPFAPGSVDAVVLTHAHIDHSGRLPLLVRGGFSGKIYSHAATADLLHVMLPDSGHIQELTQEWANRRRRRRGQAELAPLYTSADSEAVLPLLEGRSYGEPFDVPGTGFRVTLRDAGHILGSAFLEVEVGGEKVVFSGDLGNTPAPILEDPEPLSGAHHVLIESTYGHRMHEDAASKDELLAGIIRRVAERGGNLVIPAFSIGRTQELIYAMDGLQRRGAIPQLPIFVDSPMAVTATELFRRHRECFDDELTALLDSGKNPLAPSNLRLVRSVEESKALTKLPGPSVILSASGMCTAGRILHHLKHNLWRKESAVLFVGYQGVGTLGRSIRDGVKRVTILGEKVSVEASVHSIGGFSAHADQAGLTSWLFGNGEAPRSTFVVHGEVKSSYALRDRINERWPGCARVPSFRETVDLVEAPEAAEAPAPAPIELVRGFRAHRSELEARAAELTSELRDFIDAARGWAEESEVDPGRAGSRQVVREVLRQVGRMACESSIACRDFLDQAEAGAVGADTESRLVDELGRLGERLESTD